MSGRLDNYTWKRNNLTCRGGRYRHFQSRVFETLEDQLGKAQIFHFLSGPEQLQILVPHVILVILIVIVHSGLQKLIVDGFELTVERKHTGELTSDMRDQLLVFD